jgi:PAS domain S-box-containing protein
MIGLLFLLFNRVSVKMVYFCLHVCKPNRMTNQKSPLESDDSGKQSGYDASSLSANTEQHFTLKEILDTRALQSMVDDFFQMTHIGIAISDMEGRVLVSAGWQEVCTHYHRIHPETELNCLQSDLELSRGIPKGEFKLYRCKNNMWDIATPLIIGDQHLGNLFLGQFFFDDEEIDEELFRSQASRYGFDEDSYLRAVKSVPRWSKDLVNTVMSFYLKLADLISRLSHSNLILNRLLDQQRAAEDALKESEESLKQIIQAIPDPLTVIDAKTGRCLETNNSFTTLTGYSREEVLGKTAGDINLWVFPEERNKLVKGIQTDGFVEELEAEFRRKDGSTFVGLMSARLVTIKGVNCIVTITKDISQRKVIEKALSESEAKYRYLYDNALIAMFTVTLDGKPVDTNDITLQMLGYTDREHFFSTFSAPDHWVVPGERDQLISDLLDKGVIHGFQALGRRNNGAEFYAEFSIRLNPDRRTLDVAAIDVSARKQAEQELIRQKERAEESDRLKSAFLANMSHEIRTPMNGILGFTELLKEPGLTGEEQNRFVGIIQKSGDRLLSTVNDLIDISRIETGQMPVVYTDTPLIRLLESQVSFFTHQAAQKGLYLILENNLPPHISSISTDRSKLDSILSNLIKNAVKYTETGGITIGCRLKEQVLEFFVRDTGMGIPEHRKEAVFNRFEQADIADTRALQGSGLGLSIAKAYAEMLGGKIGVETSLGAGSTFWFTIPLVAGPVVMSKVMQNDVPASPPVTVHLGKRGKVLLAEDDESSYQYILAALRSVDFNIIHVTNGVEAVEQCRTNPDIDLVLMDIKMPLMDGYKATREIRSFNNTVVIVAQTAYALVGDKEKALAAGCDDYVTKPVSKGKLITMINHYLNRKMHGHD